jgi:hypothetical protein
MQIDLFSVLTLVLVCFMWGALSDRLKRIEAKTTWLEHRLEHGLAALEVEPEQSPTSRAIEDLISRGERGEAIRLYQDATGVSFAEARDHIDRLASDQS